jgi:catechol 2,3-dioxygenase
MALEHRGINRLGYVRLAVEDLELARRFALDTLGMLEHTPRSPEPDRDRVYLRCWHEAQAYSYILERGAPRLVEIGFQVRDEDELEAVADRIRAAGVAVTEHPEFEPLADIAESVTFTVPAGPVLRLFDEQDLPGYSVGGSGPDWNVPRRLRATPAPMFLTHVGITTPDPEAAIAFLIEILEFGVSELITDDEGTRTLSALLFRTNNGQDLALFPGEAVRLHHVAFAKEDETDILRDGTLLRQEGVRMDLFGPTRQSYGRTFSLHFFDPCGIRLELCSGGRFSELHPQFQPVRWTESNLDKALAFYDTVENKEFLTPSL